MLKAKHARGVTLIELIIGIAILAVLTVMAVPNFANWIGNMKIRNAAESIASGLQIARAGALKGNSLTRFQLTDSVAAGCAVSASGTSWVVSLDDAVGQCHADPSETDAPRVVQKHNGKESGGDRMQVDAGESTYIFNGLGRLTTTAASINVYGYDGEDACVHKGGAARCLKIDVSRGGNIRMCDPALPETDARGCAS